MENGPSSREKQPRPIPIRAYPIPPMKTSTLFLAVFCNGSCALAAPGDLDTGFGIGGKVTTDFGPGTGRSVAVQVDGKIVVAGEARYGDTFEFALVRYHADGSLDTSFNGTGRVITSIGDDYDFGKSVAVQADGKIVVAGSSYNIFSNDFALVRYNADGSLDTSFGGTGKITTDFGGVFEGGGSLAVQADGKIVVVGSTSDGDTSSVALVRYNADGSLDTSFGGTGKVTTRNGSGASMVLQADGKIVVAGSSYNGDDLDFALSRYNADGSLDASFGGTGRVTTHIGISSGLSNSDIGNSVAVQADGKIVVAGYSSVFADTDFAVVRYNANGSLDTSFNGTGKVTTPIGSDKAYAYSVAVQADGKIVVAGNSYSSNSDLTLVRYNANGSLDTSFGGTGKVTTDFGSRDDYGYSVVLQADGKIVVAGSSYDGTYNDFAVARYEGRPFSPFDQWKLTQLGNVNAPDLGDTDFDGLVHLAEYALNLSPTAPSLPPPAERHLYAEGERLRMFFTRDPARNDVTIEVQAADSPAGPWTTVAASALGGVTTGPGYVGGDAATPGLKTVEVRDTVNISPTTASRYLRVKVTH